MNQKQPDILQKIIARKREEVATRKRSSPVAQLEKSIFFQKKIASLSQQLRQSDFGIIAEFKRKSPSKGYINENAQVLPVTTGYARAGAAALSILTDESFFGGKNEDLSGAAHFNAIPILRKDFIIDEYQILEARAIGADAILLIAECLDKQQARQLATFARSLGLEVLMEIHAAKQLDKYCDSIQVLGVNNRNLNTFEVDIETSLRLAEQIPAGVVKISESGLSKPASVLELRLAGFQGFLMGEHFMRAPDPAQACADFIQLLQPALRQKV